MKSNCAGPSTRFWLGAACASWLAGSAQAQPVPPSATPTPAAISPASPSAPRRGEPVTLNFVNADIDAVARTMATITGRNVVVDPRVKGTITLITDRPLPPLTAFNQFTAQLRMQGLAVVEAAGLYKIVPEAEAKLQGGAVSAGVVVGGSNQIVTQIFRLQHESAGNLLPVLRPLITANNTIAANAGSNTLVITDYADNLRRLAASSPRWTCPTPATWKSFR